MGWKSVANQTTVCPTPPPVGFRLTHEMPVRGSCADLGASAEDAREFGRRAREVEVQHQPAAVSVESAVHYTGDAAPP